MTKYIQCLGSEMYFKEEGTSTLKYGYDEFKKMIMDKIGKEQQCRENVTIFFLEIDETMKEMN